MPDEITPAGTATPAAQTTTPAAPAVPVPAVDDQNPPWLAARLERDRRVLLESLGITDPAKAKEAIAAARKAEEDAKTAAEKLGETSAKLTATEQALSRERAATTEYAKALFEPLTQDRKAQVTAAIRAGGGNPDDPALQISMISALRSGWGTAAPAPATATTPAVPAPAPAAAPPATTMQPATAPAGGGTQSPPDHKAEYARLKATNPGAAVVYLQRHEHLIYPQA